MRKPVKTDRPADSEQAEFEAAVRRGIVEADAGKAISYERIRRWLLSWGSDEELSLPSEQAISKS